jgi:putative tricarboxylic transport membrane protein
MDMLHNIIYGFQVAFQPINFLFCGIGVLVGTLIGVLPGIGPAGAMALLLPATFHVSPTATLILLAGIYYGVNYGGSTTSILVNIPGEATSVITCLDGYQMARQGHAGLALGLAAGGSFIAGTIANIGLMLVAVPLANMALAFGPPEYFALMCMGLVIVTYLAQRSVLKAIMMALVGILLGSIGLDLISGMPRFTLGINELSDGIGIVPLCMGLFGITEIFENLEGEMRQQEVFKTRLRNLWPSLKDWMRCKWAILRGSLIGFILGILPGAGPIISTFVSYAVEKKVSKTPEKFGTGMMEGVAGPESANNAAAGSALIPLLSLGIPPNPIMALFFSALIIHGLQPGPLLIREHPDLFWGLVGSLYLGNLLLLILNLPLIGIWVKVLQIPYKILFPLILLFCLIGAFTMNNLSFDLYVMFFFGTLGWIMKKFGYEPAPLILAYILGPLMENNLRQSLLISQGKFMIFLTRPIAAVALSIACLLLLSNLLPFLKKRRQVYEQFKSEE